MSLTKAKLDPSKLALGPKKEILKPGASQEELESAIQQIHEDPAKEESAKRATVAEQSKEESATQAPVVQQPPNLTTERRKRLTLDMGVGLHRTIKKTAIDRGLSIRDYLLGLAKIDMGIDDAHWEQIRK